MDEDEYGPILVLEEGNSVGDTVEITERDGHFNITVDEPWAGCTETGFGQTTSVSLTEAQAQVLHDWLGARLEMLAAARNPADWVPPGFVRVEELKE